MPSSSSSSQDLFRLINGVLLVTKEFAKRSQTNNRDIETLISSSAKRAVLAATDLAGITRGKVREFSRPRPRETVVFFSDSKPDQEQHRTDSPNNAETVPVSDYSRETREIKPPYSDGIAGKEFVYENLSEIYPVKELDSFPAPENDERIVNAAVNIPENSSAEIRVTAIQPAKKRRPRERRVPSTPFSRALGFAGLGAGLAWGTIQESAKRIVYGRPAVQEGQSALSPFLSEQNAERLALALCRMRGAALKLGQMLSIQDETLIPAPILSALDIVRQGADIMPGSQLNQVLDAELGHDWSSKLNSFDYEPMASASIGQVHRAVTRDGLEVAMKIQYPGVADSIESDIENVRRLLDYTNLIPKGLYLDRAMKVAKEELSRECEYEMEAANQMRFRELLSDTDGFYVPLVIKDLSSRRVLTSELVPGYFLNPRFHYQEGFEFSDNIRSGVTKVIERLAPNVTFAIEATREIAQFRGKIGRFGDLTAQTAVGIMNPGISVDKVAGLSQDTRDYVGRKLLELTLKELFVFRFMQTDPNWSNFLYDESTQMINLIDFGAAREYPKAFVDDYLRMVLACANGERDGVIEMSRRLGFLTGMESDIMVEAHVQAGFIVGLPFSKVGSFDFRSANITRSISSLGATMLKHRMTPPPDEVYSLHRKLSGAFLACIKLGALVPCRELLLQVYKQYQFSEDGHKVLASSA